MATVQRNSLLGLPPELRLRLYRYLFPNRRIRVRIFSMYDEDDKVLYYKSKPLLASDTAVDRGITLVCQLLRVESMPILRQSLKLYCEVGILCEGQATLCIKDEYRKSIHEARFRFYSKHLDDCWSDLPALETALFECGAGFEQLMAPALNRVRKWAIIGEVNGFVESMKSQIFGRFGSSALCAVLQNKARGFRIRWRACVSFVHLYEDDEDCEALWLTFDWDSSEVVEGASDLQLHYQQIIDQEHATNSEGEVRHS